MDRDEFEKNLVLIANRLGYKLSYNSSYNRYLLFRAGSMHRVVIDQYDNVFQLYLFIRFGSMDYDIEGQPSDLVEILSILLSIYLRFSALRVSSTLLDVEHPMGQGSEGFISSGELYARLISFSQPYNDGIFEYASRSLNELEQILICIKIFEDGLSDFVGSYIGQEKYHDDSLALSEFVAFIEKCLGHGNTEDCPFSCERLNPDWLYYRRVDTGIAVVRSKLICNAMLSFLNDRDFSAVESAGYSFYKDFDVCNAFFYQDINDAMKIISSTGEKLNLIVPLENKIIVIGDSIFVSVNARAGANRFTEAKNVVLERRINENSIIFGGRFYKWCDKIDGSRFEDMIRDILYRIPGTITVRATSTTNEPDNGVDIVWDCFAPVLPDLLYSEGEPLSKRIKIIVQCKAWNSKSVSKSDIPDIRDMLDYHDASGILVVVSNRYTSSLFNHAKKLRQKGVWFDVWDRSHLENLLDKYPGITVKYNDVIESG